MKSEFQVRTGEKFAPLLLLENAHVVENAFAQEITEAAEQEIGIERKMKKPWVTEDILDLCDKRRAMKGK